MNYVYILLIIKCFVITINSECLPGQYLTGGNCIDCEPGTFSTTTDATSCTPCDFGEYQSLEGRTSCDPCPIGTYQQPGITSVCFDCPDGTTTLQEGSSLSTSCVTFQPTSTPTHSPTSTNLGSTSYSTSTVTSRTSSQVVAFTALGLYMVFVTFIIIHSHVSKHVYN